MSKSNFEFETLLGNRFRFANWLLLNLLKHSTYQIALEMCQFLLLQNDGDFEMVSNGPMPQQKVMQHRMQSKLWRLTTARDWMCRSLAFSCHRRSWGHCILGTKPIPKLSQLSPKQGHSVSRMHASYPFPSNAPWSFEIESSCNQTEPTLTSGKASS